MADTEARPRAKGSCLGRAVAVVAVLVVLLLILVALIPTLLSTGPGKRLVERAVASNINGDVTIDRLSLAWFGDQEVEGLRIVDRDGHTAVDLDVTLGNSLLSLAGGGWKTIDATLAGSVDAQVRSDGSLNLAELIADDSPPASPPSQASRPAADRPATSRDEAPPRLPAGLDATVRLNGLDVRLTEQATGRTVLLKGLTGDAVASTVRPISASIKGTSEFEGRAGTLALDAKVEDLARPDGTLVFEGAAASVIAEVKDVALPLPQMLVEVQRLVIDGNSDNLVGPIVLKVDGDAVLNSSTPSHVEADVTVNRVFDAAGAVTLRPEQAAATISATNLPTAILDPFLREASDAVPIVTARDIGPTIDAALSLPGGGGEVTASLKSEKLQVDGAGTVDAASGALSLSRLNADLVVAPELLESAAKVTASKPVPVAARFTRIVVPGAAEDGARDLGGVGFAGAVSIPEAVELRRADSTEGAELAAGSAAASSSPSFSVEGLSVTLESDSLRDGVRVGGGGTLEGGTLSIDQRLTNLIDARGDVQASRAVATGTIELEGIPPERLLALLPETAAEYGRALLTGPISLQAKTGGTPDERDIELDVASGPLTLDSDASLKGDMLDISRLVASLPVTPSLLASLQEGREKPVTLQGPTTVNVALRPVMVDLSVLDSLLENGPEMEADITIGPATLEQLPGLAGSLGLLECKALTTISPGQTLDVAVDGRARLASGGAALAAVVANLDAAVPRGEDDNATKLTATIEATDLQVAALETLLGRPSGSLTNLLGASGAVRAEVVPAAGGVTDITVAPNFQTGAGEVRARWSERVIEVPSGRLDLTLAAEQLNALFAESAASGGPASGTQEPPSLLFTAPVALQVALDGLSVDPNLLESAPTDPALTRGKVRVSTGPVAMKVSSGQTLAFESAAAEANIERLDRGVTLNAQAKAGGAAGGAGLTANGTVRGLLDAESRLATDSAVVDLNAQVTQLPTALLDRMRDLDGLLVAALGDLIDGRVTAEGLSRNAGRITADLASQNGKLTVPEVLSREGMLVVQPAKPITGELAITKPLRDRLLYRINPILADIRQTEQPLRLTIPSFSYPLDGDFTQLNGDVELTVGPVAFDAGSQLLGFLEIFNKKQAPTIPGLVEPLRAAIRAGQLTYQDFALRIGEYEGGWKHSLLFSGDIDLTQSPPYARAIKSKYPVDGLAKSIEELRQVPLLDAVSVVITFFGPMYDPDGKTKTLQHKIDFEVGLPKPEEILENPAVKDALGDLLKKLDPNKKK